jgi:hypothetical protein
VRQAAKDDTSFTLCAKAASISAQMDGWRTLLETAYTFAIGGPAIATKAC